MQVVVIVPLGAVAHRELDAEVDAEADKQHREGDRDQVERADPGEPKRHGDRETDRQAREHREDKPSRVQR